jgi:hypothetical protein
VIEKHLGPIPEVGLGNPAGAPVGSRHRQQLNGEFIAALLRDFRQGGPEAIAKVRKNQPAVYCKLLTLLCPRDVRVEHSNSLSSLTDEELDRAITAIRAMLAAQAESAKVIEGTVEPAALPTSTALDQPRRKRPNRLLEHVDTAIGPSVVRRPQAASPCKSRS